MDVVVWYGGSVVRWYGGSKWAVRRVVLYYSKWWCRGVGVSGHGQSRAELRDAHIAMNQKYMIAFGLSS